MKNGDILFPDAYEDRSFFSDIGLQTKTYLKTHNEFMLSGQYRNASAYAEGTGHEYFGAYLFNAFEGRIKNIGEYELAQDGTRIRPYYQPDEPTDDYENLTWLSSTVL